MNLHLAYLDLAPKYVTQYSKTYCVRKHYVLILTDRNAIASFNSCDDCYSFAKLCYSQHYDIYDMRAHRDNTKMSQME